MTFTVVSTFSGCGGSSLGYKLAGGRVLLAVEWDANAVETYRLNHPGTDVYHGDIAALSVDAVLARTGLQVGELDIFDGSPPCQGFSTSGKRDGGDSRNQLFREYVRLLKGLQPKTFVMENVSGMVKGQMKLIFREILTALKGCGYNVKAALLNAKNYGVPQSRERMIFIGVRADFKKSPSHPVGSSNVITLRTALRDVPQSEKKALTGQSLHLYPMIKRGGCGSKSHMALYGKAAHFGTKRLSWDKPSNTVLKMVATGMTSLCHPDEPRLMTIAELKRIGSFPDSYQFTGKFEEQWARIGNSVPPLLMKAIASHIRDNILNRQ